MRLKCRTLAIVATLLLVSCAVTEQPTRVAPPTPMELLTPRDAGPILVCQYHGSGYCDKVLVMASGYTTYSAPCKGIDSNGIAPREEMSWLISATKRLQSTDYIIDITAATGPVTGKITLNGIGVEVMSGEDTSKSASICADLVDAMRLQDDVTNSP